MGNGAHGIQVTNGAGSTTIGGTVAGQENKIAFNAGDGVYVAAGSGNSILGNAIHSNTGLGIDLGADGVNANVPGAARNYPVLASATTTGTQITITGTLNSTAGRTFRVEFFDNPTGDPSNHGEGRNFLGAANVTTDGSGNATINSTLTAGVAAGAAVSATATDSTTNETSEFALNFAAVAANTAPVLADTALVLVVAEDAGYPVGAVGSAVSAFTGGISDVDGGAKGIAVVASDETKGVWYFTTNGGTNWAKVGTVDATQSLLLADNASTRLYFAPATNVNGPSGAALTIRAWDQTSGAAGSKVSTATTGGATAFSDATDVVDVTVTAVNDTPSISSRALVFDGTDTVVVAPQASLTMSSAVTVEAMVQRTGALTGTQIIVNKEGEYEVGILVSGKLAYAFANTTPGWTWVETTYTVPTDTWVHLAVSYDNGVVKTYADGVLVDTTVGTGNIGDVYAGLNDLTIGGRQNAVTQRFVGLIDEVRVWNVARSGAQILAAYDATLTGAEAGLVGYWRFEETSGNDGVERGRGRQPRACSATAWWPTSRHARPTSTTPWPRTAR